MLCLISIKTEQVLDVSYGKSKAGGLGGRLLDLQLLKPTHGAGSVFPQILVIMKTVENRSLCLL